MKTKITIDFGGLEEDIVTFHIDGDWRDLRYNGMIANEGFIYLKDTKGKGRHISPSKVALITTELIEEGD